MACAFCVIAAAALIVAVWLLVVEIRHALRDEELRDCMTQMSGAVVSVLEFAVILVTALFGLGIILWDSLANLARYTRKKVEYWEIITSRHGAARR